MRRCNVEGKYCTVAAGVLPKQARFLSSSTGLMGAFISLDQHLALPLTRMATGDSLKSCRFPQAEADVTALLARRKKFDSDLWVVEVEDRDGTAGITAAKI